MPRRLLSRTVARVFSVVVLVLVVLGIGSSAASAACTKSWAGPTSGTNSWDDGANWSPSGVPTGSSDVCIKADGTYTVTMPSYRTIWVRRAVGRRRSP